MAGRAGEHQFVASVAGGLVGAGLSPAGGQVELTLDGAAPVGLTIATHGPGDVTALAPSAITRMTPPPGTRTFEPNLFAAIELAHPALPWMVSPVRTPRLPWLALVVVEDGEGVDIDASTLTLQSPAVLARELPDLNQAWAWVHAHGTGAAGDAIAPAAFAHSVEPTVARLLCPRQLEPEKRYHAALVPAFEAGRRAGLGEAPGGGDALAWTAATALPLRLPVYRTWSFTTGEGGDFASLARALRARPLADEAGQREVDASRPGWDLPEVGGRTVTVGGVLRPASAPPISAGADDLGATIASAIDAAAVTPEGEVPLLPPPLYGGHALGTSVIAGGPAWLARHNGDVRLRIAAGLGAEVVRRQQEELVDAAWRELGDAEAANQLARQAELAAAISGRLLDRYLDPMSDDELVQVTRPSHRRLRLEDAPAGQPPRHTLAALIDDSALPTRGISAAFRRIAGPGARAARAVAAAGLIDRANRAALAVVPPRGPPGGIAALDAISEAEAIQPRFSSARPAAIDEAAIEWKTPQTPLRPADGMIAMARRRETHIPDEETEWTPEPPSTVPDPDPVQIDEFAAASRRHQRYLVEHLGQLPAPTPRRPLAGGQLHVVRTRFRAAAAPAAALVPPLAARITGHATTLLGDLRPVTVTPTFERPLIHGLRAVGLQHVLPGIDLVPADTVALLAPDHDAVHGFLLGANQELASELSWRGFPAPAGMTPLRTFWGRTGTSSGGVVRLPDIPPVRDWPAAGPDPAPVNLVLLIRGALIERYPGAIVYLMSARWEHTRRVLGEGAPRPPLIQVNLAADTALYGFDLDAATVEGLPHPGDAGWYVVIEEHPQEPRFGLAAGPEREMVSWRDLTWTRVAAGDLRGTHLLVDGPLASLQPQQPAGLRWGADSAQLAAITLRRPTRIAIHASLLVRPATPG